MDESLFDREALLAMFLEETEEGLASAEQDLVRLEAAPADDETLNRIFRVAHTLKGNAGALALPVPAEFTHALEDLLDLVRKRRVEATGPVVTLLLQAMDVLKSMVPDAVADPAAPMRPGHRALMETLAGAAHFDPVAAAPAADVPLARTAAAGRSLRVPVERLDRMLNLGGEISIARGRLASLLQHQPEGPAREALLDTQREVDALFLELQEEIARVRTVPVAQMFRRFGRAVRDLAAAQGKRVRLVMEGEQLEVDTSVVELISDPLTHLVRNAVDHGIEPPDERVRRGKPAEGCITLRARRGLGRVAIELSDDGRGLSRERILARAHALGWGAAADALPEAELLQLVFEPGFSTAERVSDISGRGIGLDVVRRNVEALRGTVALESREGGGTTVVIQLPLTLAVIRGFSVRVGDERFVVASDDVVECLDHAPGAEASQAAGVLSLRGEAVPFLRLRHRLGVSGRAAERENVLIVRHGTARAGLAVDEVIGECEAVVKPLGRLLNGLPGLAGATILADGQVALILDEAALLSAAASGVETAASGASEPA